MDREQRPPEAGAPQPWGADGRFVAGPAVPPAGPPGGVPVGPPGGHVAGQAAEAVLTGAAYAALGVLGLVFGLIGSFAQGWLVGSVPVAAIVLVAVNFGVVRLAAWAMRSPLGGVVFATGWGVVVLLMSLPRSEGDLTIPGTLSGYVFIVGGLVAAVVAAALQPGRRPPGQWLLRGAQPAAGDAGAGAGAAPGSRGS
ncbi:hypothetical protein Arub01_04710 [Actinomadura rubrobrunea]|uniref:Integral membrane protein n=2 Tax=Actinomadura rubrobrunea TaxID=115335 RepID=A0A9W6PRQ3_9ACTN|nr:DUF6113 family protein [Actinomadura rubrobrunea]GLW62227.1 hypothetical protein Arub01_04710 [Actinomadura rubrobrunea]